MTEQVGHQESYCLNTARSNLAGAGTQTAALAFGGQTQCTQQQNYMMAQLGHQILQD
jgi:hypothetical protein